jgi:transcriptional regulator with XRE-family HTH domain
MIEKPEVKIKQIRELKNLTQEYVAVQLGLSTRAYSRIEQGETELTIKRLNEICQILEIDPLQLIDFDAKRIFSVTGCTGNNGVGAIYNSFPEEKFHLIELRLQRLEEQIRLIRISSGN